MRCQPQTLNPKPETLNRDIGEDSQQAIIHARASCGVLRGTVSQAIDVRSSISAGYMPTPRSDVRVFPPSHGM